MQVTADPSGRAGISSATIPSNSIAFGSNQSLSGTNTVTIGNSAQTTADYSTAVGAGSKAGSASLAGGYGAEAGSTSVALGSYTKATGTSSVAVGYFGNDSGALGNNSIAIGSNNVKAVSNNSIAIGNGAQTDSANSASGSVAIGLGALAQKNTAGYGAPVAIGEYPVAKGTASLAIGSFVETGTSGANMKTTASAHASTAIGGGAAATKRFATALGCRAEAKGEYSVAIGSDAKTSTNYQIVLGTSSHTVYIPGNLVVDGDVRFRRHAYIGEYLSGDDVAIWAHLGNRGMRGGIGGWDSLGGLRRWSTGIPGACDRRLKNVGAKYTDGLDALKKLEFYHYTFKKDESKTPHVGVMAQDLQKVFPNAVTKGEDGFLRIRMEDMFYALINAVKELDLRYTRMKSTIDEQQKTIDSMQKQIDELTKIVKAEK